MKFFLDLIPNGHNYDVRGKMRNIDLHKHSWAAHGLFCFFPPFHWSLFLYYTVGFHSSILSSPHAPTLLTLSQL